MASHRTQYSVSSNNPMAMFLFFELDNEAAQDFHIRRFASFHVGRRRFLFLKKSQIAVANNGRLL